MKTEEEGRQATYAGAERKDGKSLLLVVESILHRQGVHGGLGDFVGWRGQPMGCAGQRYGGKSGRSVPRLAQKKEEDAASLIGTRGSPTC